MTDDPTRPDDVLVDLPDVRVLKVDRSSSGFDVHVESSTPRPGCAECSMPAHVKDRPVVVYVDLEVYGKPALTGSP